MKDNYVAVYLKGEEKPCGAMPLKLAFGILPRLKQTGRDYYAQLITSAEAVKIRKSITEEN